ncbi:MAG: hypothetical protein HXY37_18315 [Chloroflexi bacterium]|nr:hypothetical protein [Chloroflexota bacterium]
MHENFFVYQRRALRPLLAWGIGSSLLGTALLPFRGAARHFGIQAVAWGVIDVLLAMAGRRRALLRAEALAAHQLDEAVAAREAEQFERILRFNAGLDLLYIAAGLVTALRFASRPDRRGLGAGIAVQGVFLLLFDLLLAREVEQKYL